MNYEHLSEKERYHIEINLRNKIHQKDIAIALGRSESTISNEIKRNKGKKGYRHKQAQRNAEERLRRKPKNIKLTATVIAWITKLLKQQLSPEQICAYLFKHKNTKLHHETIYRFIYADKQAGGDLWRHLRIVIKSYRKRYGSNSSRKGKIPNRVSIHDRPQCIDEKTRIGDLEGDLIIGKNNQGALLTLVDRKTLYTYIVTLQGKHAQPIVDKAIALLGNESNTIHSITFDNGLEFAKHEQITETLGIKTYFADPYSSWQRGANENTNGLIRQYFPKNTNFIEITDDEVQAVQDTLNNRPRKTLDFKSPNELFHGKFVDLLVA